MTASIKNKKQNKNKNKKKGAKERYLLGQNTTCEICVLSVHVVYV